MADTYEIKITTRNSKTGEVSVGVAPEIIARAIYGDQVIDTVIANKKISNILETKNNG